MKYTDSLFKLSLNQIKKYKIESIKKCVNSSYSIQQIYLITYELFK